MNIPKTFRGAHFNSTRPTCLNIRHVTVAVSLVCKIRNFVTEQMWFPRAARESLEPAGCTTNRAKRDRMCALIHTPTHTAYTKTHTHLHTHLYQRRASRRRNKFEFPMPPVKFPYQCPDYICITVHGRPTTRDGDTTSSLVKMRESARRSLLSPEWNKWRARARFNPIQTLIRALINAGITLASQNRWNARRKKDEFFKTLEWGGSWLAAFAAKNYVTLLYAERIFCTTRKVFAQGMRKMDIELYIYKICIIYRSSISYCGIVSVSHLPRSDVNSPNWNLNRAYSASYINICVFSRENQYRTRSRNTFAYIREK